MEAAERKVDNNTRIWETLARELILAAKNEVVSLPYYMFLS